MKLSKQEQELKELSQEAKGLLDSNLFKALRNRLNQELDKEFPKPDHKGWEEEYRYAKAYAECAKDIIGYIIQLKDQMEMLVQKEKEEEPSIEEA